MTDQTPPETPAPRTGPRPFTDFLVISAQNKRINDELGMDFAGLVQEVTESGKAGAITIKLVVEPDDHRTITTRLSYKVTKPPMDAVKALLFVDDAGGVHRDDPYQRSWDFDHRQEQPAEPLTDHTGAPIAVDKDGVVTRPGELPTD